MPRKDIEELGQDSWRRLQEMLEQFEADANASNPLDFGPYLPEAVDVLRPLMLEELIRTDLELRWRGGQTILLEEYLRLYPEVDPVSIPKLLLEEFRVRGRFGEKPTVEEYQARFPTHYESFRQARQDTLWGERLTPPGEAPASGSSEDLSLENIPAVGEFERVRKIGRGSFGEVWEARAPGGVPVAIKRILASVPFEILERERKSLDLICSGKLRHPFLLQIFGYWMVKDRLCIMMELADESLDDRLKRARKNGETGLEPEFLRRVMLDAAEALDFLNIEKKVLHRDVKPANMLLMGGRVKLADFGLARVFEQLVVGAGKTTGAGTPVFIAPEIIRGFQSRQSDQYSLAVSYYQLRTGKQLFAGKVFDIRRQHLYSIPNFDPLLSPHEQMVLRKALSKFPGDRFDSCQGFVSALVAALDELPARRPNEMFSADKSPSRNTPSAVGQASRQASGPAPAAPRRSRLRNATGNGLGSVSPILQSLAEQYEHAAHQWDNATRLNSHITWWLPLLMFLAGGGFVWLYVWLMRL